MAAKWYQELMLLQGGAAEEGQEKGLGCLWAEFKGGSGPAEPQLLNELLMGNMAS